MSLLACATRVMAGKLPASSARAARVTASKLPVCTTRVMAGKSLAQAAWAMAGNVTSQIIVFGICVQMHSTKIRYVQGT